MIKLGIVQTKSYKSDDDAIERTSRELLGMARKETDVVCLPEQWLVENKIDDFDVRFSAFKKISKEYAMTIIPGAFYERFRRGYAISAPVIHGGEVVGRQEKIHPFGYERGRIRPGTEARVFKAKARFGIIICYDMVFADVASTMAKKGAEVLFSPSRIVKRGIKPWHVYVQARSLENRIPILAANVSNAKFGGHSVVVDLKEKNKVMIPRLDVLGYGQSSTVSLFRLSEYKKSRNQRYKDKMRFS